MSELRGFTEWLDANHVKGFIGEVGWPDDRRHEARLWNALARDWFREADRHGLWVTIWATGEWWHDYPLGIYQKRGDAGVDFANAQAPVLESEFSVPGCLRGVSVCGGEFGTPADGSFSNVRPGVEGRSYHFDGGPTFHYLVRRGVQVVRIPFRWERLQPRLGQGFDPDELARLKQAVGSASRAGMAVILDPHNYGEYWLFDGTKGVRRTVGTTRLPTEDFADLWRRISRAFKDEPRVYYGLMNEPHDFPSTEGLSGARSWERSAQAGLDAIRGNGDRKLVLVPGYHWSGVRTWRQDHPTSWISDPVDNFRYEAHDYWDADGSGTYRQTYADETAALRAGATRPAGAAATKPASPPAP